MSSDDGQTGSYRFVRRISTDKRAALYSLDTQARVLYVGTLNVRKGVPTLLKAWKHSGIDGELVLAGVVALDGEGEAGLTVSSTAGASAD